MARILGPIVSTLDKLDTVVKEDEQLEQYITTIYGSVEQCRKDILRKPVNNYLHFILRMIFF